MKKYLLNPVGMLLAGLSLGIIIRLLDLYTTNLGNLFSELAVWILLGTVISIYSATPKAAMVHLFPFCMGMLLTYYATAILTNGVYHKTYMLGWTAFALCVPFLGCLAWMAKCKGMIAKGIGVGIVFSSLLSSILLFDRLRIYDFVIAGLLAYFLFCKKIAR